MDINRMHAPVGFPVGSEEKVVMANEATMKSGGYKARRVSEICLSDDEKSRVN